MKYFAFALLSGLVAYSAIQSYNSTSASADGQGDLAFEASNWSESDFDWDSQRDNLDMDPKTGKCDVDLDGILRDQNSRSCFALFLASAKAVESQRWEDAGFLYFAARMRGLIDCEAYPPSHAINWYVSLSTDLGLSIKPNIMRNPDVYDNIIQRLERWEPEYTKDDKPLWNYQRRMKLGAIDAVTEKHKGQCLTEMRGMSKLLNDPEYARLFKMRQDQHADLDILRVIVGDPDYQPVKLSKTQLAEVEKQATMIETKYGFGPSQEFVELMNKLSSRQDKP